MFTRIQWRIAATYLGLLAALLLGLGIYLAIYLRAEELRTLEGELRSEALLVAEHAQHLLSTEGEAPLDRLVKRLGPETGARITLIGLDGRVLADSDADVFAIANQADLPEVIAALQTGHGQSQRYSPTLHSDLLFVSVRMEDAGEPLGVARVGVAASELEAEADQVLIAVGWALLAAVALSVPVAIVLARFTAHRIQTLTAAAERLARGNLELRVPVEGRDEVSVLARAFNHMADRLRAQLAELRTADLARRDFVANVSHDLRTPVAGLAALVETLDDGALDDPSVAHEFLGRMRVEVDRLGRLVEDLLELSRVEAGQIVLHPQPVDLATVVRRAAERMRPLAERHGVRLDVAPGVGPAWARVDAARIEEVVVNLVHNALKFTPPGGTVTVTTTCQSDDIRVGVADTGVGIAPADLGRIFERFYKADRARAARGTGLGLAIAQQVIHAHGGRIWAESAGEGTGATLTFVLPLATAGTETSSAA